MMLETDAKVQVIVKQIDDLHYTIERTNWSTLNKEGFVFELQRCTEKLKAIHANLSEVNRELNTFLEKDTPDVSDFLEKLRKHIVVLESNIAMERTKRFKLELVNETEEIEVPELYSSLQNQIMQDTLTARYSIEKIRTFLSARNTPFIKKGNTAKNLIEILQNREDELSDLRQKNLELKRNKFFGSEERSLADIESTLNEHDKKLEMAVKETNTSLKTHLAQIRYVEGSFSQLSEKISQIENNHERFTKEALGAIKEFKKERDFARKMALDIEQETMQLRANYTRNLLEMENRKNELRENISKKYSNEIKMLKKEVSDKNITIANLSKLIEEQENEVKKLKNIIRDEEINE